jgi:hypothetical protein
MTSAREIVDTLLFAEGVGQEDLVAAIEAYAVERERAVWEQAAKACEVIRDKWNDNANNIARANDVVGGLAQSTYRRYADTASECAATIRAAAEGRST